MSYKEIQYAFHISDKNASYILEMISKEYQEMGRDGLITRINFLLTFMDRTINEVMFAGAILSKMCEVDSDAKDTGQ